MYNNVDSIIIMVREQGLGRSGNIVVVVREVVRILKKDISCSMRVFTNKMAVATRGIKATMLSLHLALNGNRKWNK